MHACMHRWMHACIADTRHAHIHTPRVKESTVNKRPEEGIVPQSLGTSAQVSLLASVRVRVCSQKYASRGEKEREKRCAGGGREKKEIPAHAIVDLVPQRRIALPEMVGAHCSLDSKHTVCLCTHTCSKASTEHTCTHTYTRTPTHPPTHTHTHTRTHTHTHR